MRKLIAAAAFTLALGGVALAQTGQSGPMTRPSSTPQGAAPGQSGTILSESDVHSKLQADGYSNVSGLKREGNKYSAKAMKDGREVSLSIDARNGKVEPSTMR
jgi:Peptidase propeptide and YPEB domain